MQAVSYAGWQVPIRTDSAYTKARIESHRRRARARRPGRRQGGHHHRLPGHRRRRATSPRWAAAARDTSAVAVAAAMKADECLIYTDVDGVYTTDPRIVPEARRLHTISFEEMLEMASLGSKVLQIRSVEFAGKYRVPLRVLSSFTPWDIDIAEEAASGTLITFEEDEKMEQAVVSGIAFNRDEAKITVIGVPDKPGIAYQILGPVADANIDIDVIIQNVSHDGTHRLLLHRQPQRLPAHAGPAEEQRAAGHRRGRGHRRPEDLQGVDRRHRHAQPRRRGQPRCSARSAKRASTSR